MLELMGVKVKGAALGGVTLFAIAEESTPTPHGATMNVCWGQNAAYGELGIGEGRPKSATKPQRWDALDNVAVLEIGAGLGTTFILARNQGDTYQDLPRWPEEIPVPSDVCQVCHKNDDAAAEQHGDLLECEKCNLAYHLACLAPPLDAVPEGEWHCPVCTDRGVREVGFPLPYRADDPDAPPVDLDEEGEEGNNEENLDKVDKKKNDGTAPPAANSSSFSSSTTTTTTAPKSTKSKRSPASRTAGGAQGAPTKKSKKA